MRCPFCGHDETQVKDSRPSEDNSAIRRKDNAQHAQLDSLLSKESNSES